MTPNQRPPFALLVSLIIVLVATSTAPAAPRGKKGGKSAPAPSKAEKKSAKADKKSRPGKEREQAAAKKSSKKESRADKRADKKESKKESRAERRERELEERAAGRGGKGGRAAAKRERAAQARREAEERRRRAEAEERRRRAELARLAAIARQRALDEGLRSEVQNNIMRDDPTGEDPEVRRVAVAALGRAAGTVVVMNPKTGQIYTIVNQQWGVRRGFKPCSTTKLITGLAGLGERVIDPIAENVSYGQPTLTSALARSAPNSYFQQVGRRVGFERMVSYARQLGLGERTGINHVGEYPGRLPLFKNDTGMLRMSSHGDDIEVTAVQLASLASVFATGGTLVTPHLPRTPEENVKFRTEVRRQLNIPQENLRRMLVAMVGAVNYGSARKTYDPNQTIAGKTGTCIDTDRTKWVGLFTSFAPVEDPQLAVAVITSGTDARKHLPVAIANQIYRTLSYRFGRRGNRPAFQLTPDAITPRPTFNAPAIAEADDVDEAEADAREELNGAPAAASTAPAAGDNGLRPTLMPASQPQQQRPAASSAPAPSATKPAPAQPQRTVSPGDDRPRRVPDQQRQ